MTPSEHFMRHAAECEVMAKRARDAESKAVWSGMAKRWQRCADLANQQSDQQRESARSRRSARTLSHAAVLTL
jgi:hypothetical protein